jgi:hypothetical protein
MSNIETDDDLLGASDTTQGRTTELKRRAQ